MATEVAGVVRLGFVHVGVLFVLCMSSHHHVMAERQWLMRLLWLRLTASGQFPQLLCIPIRVCGLWSISYGV
jgi:hypothetical protein